MENLKSNNELYCGGGGELKPSESPVGEATTKKRQPVAGDRVVLGKVSGSLWRKEELTDGQLNHHVHVVGASGYGKTVFLSHIIKQRIQQGKGVLFIDLKGDIETIMKFSKFVADSDRIEDLQIFSLSDQKLSIPYNLIEDGTPTQLRDKIMLALNWSEEFYKNQSASFLLKLLIGLCYLRDHQSFRFHLGTILEATTRPEFVEELSLRVPESERRVKSALEECFNFLNGADNFKSLQGLRTQIESLVLSDFGDMITSVLSEQPPHRVG